MTANNYDKIVNRLNIIVKEVANETIRDASEDLLSKIKDPNEDTVIDTRCQHPRRFCRQFFRMLHLS